jgi:DNA repair exonuclease SbcCD ATPase subunit
MRGIYNNARITKNLSVYLALPGMTILRKKNSDLLSITMSDGKVYEDTIAQSIINDTYGHRELWRACSYIEQKSRCSLLSGSGSERMELLNALSFTGENPKEYINKIVFVLKEKTYEFEQKQTDFIYDLNLYTKTLNERSIKFLYQDEDILKLELIIENISENMKVKNEEVLEQERLLGTLNYLYNNEKELNNKILCCSNKYLLEYPTILTFNEQEIIIPENLFVTNKYIIEDLEIISFPNYTNLKNKYNLEIKKLLEQMSYDKDTQKMEEELKKIEIELEDISELEVIETKQIKQEDIWNASKLETERQRNMDEAKGIGLQYDDNIIRNTINELSEQLKRYNLFESQIDNYNKLLQLENKIESFEKFSEDISVLETLYKEKSLLINDMKKGLELLSCPKCGVSLRYQNNSLNLGERDPVSKNDILVVEKDILLLNEKIQKYREIIKLNENKDFISKTLDREAIKEYITNSRSKVSSLSALINRISKIRYIPEISKEETSETLTYIYNYQTLKNKRETLIQNIQKRLKYETDSTHQYNKYLVLLQQLEERYQEEQKRILKNQEIIRKHQQIEAERLKTIAKYEEEKKKREQRRIKLENDNMEKIRRYEDEKKKSEMIENEKVSLQNRIIENTREIEILKGKINLKVKEDYLTLCKSSQEEKEKLDDAIYTIKTLKFGKELEEKREVLLKLQNDVQALTNLKIRAVEVECKQLEDTVNNINTVLETTLPIFFNEPISLTLQLYKKLKTEVIKPGLNLEICYKGFKYDNINSLSGGEGDRISLGLLLALNSVSNSLIILLDECVSSLDGDLKENCITAIKSIPNKTVICVDHDDALEGFYDSIIDIS